MITQDSLEMKDGSRDKFNESDFEKMEIDKDIDCVVLAFHDDWNYKWIAYASLCI